MWNFVHSFDAICVGIPAYFYVNVISASTDPIHRKFMGLTCWSFLREMRVVLEITDVLQRVNLGKLQKLPRNHFAIAFQDTKNGVPEEWNKKSRISSNYDRIFFFSSANYKNDKGANALVLLLHTTRSVLICVFAKIGVASVWPHVLFDVRISLTRWRASQTIFNRVLYYYKYNVDTRLAVTDGNVRLLQCRSYYTYRALIHTGRKATYPKSFKKVLAFRRLTGGEKRERMAVNGGPRFHLLSRRLPRKKKKGKEMQSSPSRRTIFIRMHGSVYRSTMYNLMSFVDVRRINSIENSIDGHLKRKMK